LKKYKNRKIPKVLKSPKNQESYRQDIGKIAKLKNPEKRSNMIIKKIRKNSRKYLKNITKLKKFHGKILKHFSLENPENIFTEKSRQIFD